MSHYTIETRELEELRRKYSVACSLITEQSATITTQAGMLRIQADDIAFMRKMLLKVLTKVSPCETAP